MRSNSVTFNKSLHFHSGIVFETDFKKKKTVRNVDTKACVDVVAVVVVFAVVVDVVAVVVAVVVVERRANRVGLFRSGKRPKKNNKEKKKKERRSRRRWQMLVQFLVSSSFISLFFTIFFGNLASASLGFLWEYHADMFYWLVKKKEPFHSYMSYFRVSEMVGSIFFCSCFFCISSKRERGYS